MRRVLAVVLVVVLVAAACGDDDSEPDAAAADPTPTAEASAGDGADVSDASDAPSDTAVLVVSDARYRRANEGLGAAYMVITNTGDEPVSLSAASSTAAGRVEIHETVTDEEGLMGMVEVPEGFEIPAGGELVLEPGGKHLMLMDLADDAGDTITMDLVLGGETVSVPVAFDPGASADHDHGDEGSMDHGGEGSMDHGGEGSMDRESMNDGEG